MARILMQHPSGVKKLGYTGFSWATLIFGPLIPLSRGDAKWFAVSAFMPFIFYMITSLFMVTVAIGGMMYASSDLNVVDVPVEGGTTKQVITRDQSVISVINIAQTLKESFYYAYIALWAVFITWWITFAARYNDWYMCNLYERGYVCIDKDPAYGDPQIQVDTEPQV